MAKGATTGKRKVRALAVDDCDASLVVVAHALENLTRAGALLASGASERYPPCALALVSGNDADELHFPITKHDTQRIQTCAKLVKSATPVAPVAKGKKPSGATGGGSVWEVDAASLLAQRNPRWEAFVSECFEKTRMPLGIAATAKIEIALRKLVVVEAGGALQVRRPEDEEETRVETSEAGRDGVFGALVVTLPGAFKGGELSVGVQQATNDKHSSWRPGTRKTPYDLTFAAVYDQSGCVAKPVTSGVAAFLVYDLKTTTPNDVPRYGGSAALQQGVLVALSDFFAADPTTTATPAGRPSKRIHIDPETGRETVDSDVGKNPRHFAYLIGGRTFEKLNAVEKYVLEQLIAFCAQSNGKYVLYLSGVLCSRESAKFKGYGHHDWLSQTDGELKLTLKTPWLRHGASTASTFPPIYIDQEHDVAPLGRAEDLDLYVDVYDMAMFDYEIVEKRHYNFRKTGVANTFALVVRPASVDREHNIAAK